MCAPESTLHRRAGTSDSGDHYTGLDRFDRVIDQKWVISTFVRDEYTYKYDRDPNVFNDSNTQHTAFNMTYSYDSLGQLISAARNDGGSANQAWTLDALGNMTAVKTGSTTVNQTTNSDNQLTTVGSGTITYDNNGNMITDASGNTYVYDAWNHLVLVTNSVGAWVVAYTYDGTGRRIQEIANNGADGATTTDYYFNGQQDIEEKQGATVTAKYYWSNAYEDALIARDNGSRIYVTYDVSYNVTALLGSSTVLQRFVYNSYGTQTVYTPSWATTSDSYNWVVGYQGLMKDTATGLWYNRARWYSDTLERFINVDPAEEGMNWYESRADNPVGEADITGLATSQPSTQPATQPMDPFTISVTPASGYYNKSFSQAGLFGQTLASFEITVDLEPCASRSKWMIKTEELDYYIYITVDEAQAKKGSTIDGVYGHEQAHEAVHEKIISDNKATILKQWSATGLGKDEGKPLPSDGELTQAGAEEFIKPLVADAQSKLTPLLKSYASIAGMHRGDDPNNPYNSMLPPNGGTLAPSGPVKKLGDWKDSLLIGVPLVPKG